MLIVSRLFLLMKEKVHTDQDHSSTNKGDSSYRFNFNLRSLSKIAIPIAPSKVSPRESPPKPAPRANLKQLYQFLKNQVIVVRQKDRFISNKEAPSAHSPTSHLNSSLTKALCLSSHLSSQQLCALSTNLHTVCLPKIQQKPFISPEQQLQNSRERNKCKRMFKPEAPKKRNRTVCSNYSNVEHAPLICNISRRISTQNKHQPSPNPPNKEIVDYYLYRQSPHLNKISLNLAVELSNKAKRQSTYQ